MGVANLNEEELARALHAANIDAVKEQGWPVAEWPVLMEASRRTYMAQARALLAKYDVRPTPAVSVEQTATPLGYRLAFTIDVGFGEADPDRIMAIFRDDMAKVLAARKPGRPL